MVFPAGTSGLAYHMKYAVTNHPSRPTSTTQFPRMPDLQCCPSKPGRLVTPGVDQIAVLGEAASFIRHPVRCLGKAGRCLRPVPALKGFAISPRQS